MNRPDFTIRPDDPRTAAVSDLLALHLEQSRANTPAAFAFALDPDGLSAADVTFWTVWDGGALAGIGALRALGDRHGEIKSMRTAADHVGKGVARALLAHIVGVAAARGYRRLSLETGMAPTYDAAVALYRRAGFVDCGPYGGYRDSPHNRFMTLTLQEH